jgi:hypothetical protein
MAMKALTQMRNEKGFLTLIELLVVMVIILGMFWVFSGPGRSPAGPGGGVATPGGGMSTPGMAIRAAKGAECASNLNSIRQAIQVYKTTSEGRPPGSLEELRLAPDYLRCPVSKQPYTYDPQTGQVQCTTPGHQRL